jgi:hypothetical protein
MSKPRRGFNCVGNPEENKWISFLLSLIWKKLAMADAEKNGSQIIFTNDGDGDRLGVAERVKE